MRKCKSFRNGGFANAGLADQDRIVLFSAAQDLGDAFKFLFTADNGIKPAFFGSSGDVAAEIIKHRGL